MLSEARPSREAVTTSLTCFDDVDVKNLIISGMMAPASVPAADDRRELPPKRLVGAEADARDEQYEQIVRQCRPTRAM